MLDDAIIDAVKVQSGMLHMKYKANETVHAGIARLYLFRVRLTNAVNIAFDLVKDVLAHQIGVLSVIEDFSVEDADDLVFFVRLSMSLIAIYGLVCSLFLLVYAIVLAKEDSPDGALYATAHRMMTCMMTALCIEQGMFEINFFLLDSLSLIHI